MGAAVQMRVAKVDHRSEEVQASRQRCLNLISRLIHDMSQPLTVLQGELDLALSTISNTIEYRDVIELSLKEIERLTKLVQRLREVAELETPAELTSGTPLLASIRSAVEMLGPVAESKGVHITLETGADCEVLVSPDRLKQALCGILQKAIDRTSQGGKLLITSSLHNNNASFLIIDSGQAVGPDELKSLLDPLQRNPAFRLDLTASGSLEWYFAKRVVESAGGAFTIDNRANRGCEVLGSLPVSPG